MDKDQLTSVEIAENVKKAVAPHLNINSLAQQIRQYGRQKCKEQREICKREAKMASDYLPSKDKIQYFIDSHSILNASGQNLSNR